MPLYMDFHQFDTITVEDVKQAHMVDKAVQDKYGVKYHQVWVNEDAGTVFCLAEGPDPESCIACHQEAHGNFACNISEVEPEYFNLFMGKNRLLDREDVALTNAGEIDPGDRTILVADIRGINGINDVKENKNLLIATQPKNLVVDEIRRHKGRFVNHSWDDNLVGVFNIPVNALGCAKRVQSDLTRLANEYGKGSEWNVTFKLGLYWGQPMTKDKGFFEAAIKNAKRLALIAGNNQIALSSNLRSFYEIEIRDPGAIEIKTLSKPEEEFIVNLFEIVEQNLQLASFGVNNLSEQIGMSRPQLYRKITYLTGKSPNDFIKFIRLNKALSLLRSGEGNISEIAMEVGYANPSHFAKVFNDNFGYPPSKLLVEA